MKLLGTNIRHMLYEQKGGYLLVPFFIMFALSSVAIILPLCERSMPSLRALFPFTAPSDPAMAQLLLGAIAGSCITILSVVYSVLLIALTFASMQFSPRILTMFVKDRVSQGTLGIFIGTFTYCLILLPNVRGGLKPDVPSLSLAFALLLSAGCVFFLIIFIHHIAIAIQANHIVNRIAVETEKVLRIQYGAPLKGFPREEEPLVEPATGASIMSLKTGYVQYVEEEKLVRLAVEADVSWFMHRGIGQFIPAGIACLTASPASRLTDELRTKALSCFHLGALRSMEDDIQFGMLQMVDIALKAISPAVNDPSTAICCIDHLSAILIVAATLEPPPSRLLDEKGVVRLEKRQQSFALLLEIAFNQIGPYGKGDMAVSLRLMRALYDISGVTNYAPYLQAIRQQAEQIYRGCAECSAEEELKDLRDRLTVIESRRRSASTIAP